MADNYYNELRKLLGEDVSSTDINNNQNLKIESVKSKPGINVYDADTVYVNGTGYRSSAIDSPEMPKLNEKLDRLQKAKESKLGRFVSKANAGEKAAMEAYLGTLDKDTSITKGLGDTAVSFNDFEKTPQVIDYGTENLAKSNADKGKFGRVLADNPEYEEKAVKEGFAVPYSKEDKKLSDLMFNAKYSDKGLWGTDEKDIQAVANKRGVGDTDINPNGMLGEAIDTAQSSLTSQYAKVNKAMRKGTRWLAGKTGLSEETVDKWLPKTEDTGTVGFGDISSDTLATREAADAITGVMVKTRKEQDTAMKNAEEAIKRGDYVEAGMEAFSVLPYILGDSAGEIATMMIPGAGVPLTVAARVSEQAEEYKKNNGKEPDTTWLVKSALTNTAAIVGEKAILKVASKSAFKPKSKLGKRVGSVAGATGIEAAQEWFDETQQKYLTQKEGEQTLGEVATSPSTQLAALTGGIAGGTLSGAANTAGVAKDIKDKLKTKLASNSLQDRVHEVDKATNFDKYTDVDKKEAVQDVLDHAAVASVDFDYMKKTEGTDTISQLVPKTAKRIAKINGLDEKNASYLYEDVLDGITNSLGSRASSFTNRNKLGMLKDLYVDTKDKILKKAVENETKKLMAEELSDIADKVQKEAGVALDTSKVKLTEEDLNKVNAVLTQIRSLGSESLDSEIKGIEDTIRGLGKKKTYAEVANDIKKAGFLFYGKAYKGLEQHEADIEKEVALDKDTNATDSFVNFIDSRSADKVRFKKKLEDGRIVPRDLDELKSFIRINREDNENIAETLDRIINKLEEGSKRRAVLEKAKAKLNTYMGDVNKMLKAQSVQDFESIYREAVRSDRKIEPKAEIKTEPKAEKSAPKKSKDLGKMAETLVSRRLKKGQTLEQIQAEIDSNSEYSVEGRTAVANYVRSLQNKEAKKEPKVKEEVKPKTTKVKSKPVEKPKAVETLDELSEIKFRISTNEEFIKLTEGRVNTLKDTLQKEKARLTAIKVAIERIKTRRAGVDTKLKQTARDVAKDYQKLELLEKELKGLEKEEKFVRQELDKNEGKDTSRARRWVADLNDMLAKIKKVLKTTRMRLTKLRNKLRPTFDKIESLEKDLDRLDKMLEAKYSMFKQRKKALEPVKAKLKEETTKLKEAKQELREDKKAVQDKVELKSEQVSVSNELAKGFTELRSIKNTVYAKVTGTNQRKAAVKEATEPVLTNLMSTLEPMMPKSVKKLMAKDDKYMYKAVQGFARFVNGNADNGYANAKLPVPRQGKSSPIEFINTWLDDDTKRAKLEAALDVTALVTMDDMISLRNMNSTQLEDVVAGALGNLSRSKTDPIFKQMLQGIKRGEYVPMSTFIQSAGARVERELGIMRNKDKLGWQEKQDIQTALGQLVMERAKLSLRASENVSSKDLGIVPGALEVVKSNGYATKLQPATGKVDPLETRRVVYLDRVDKKQLRQTTSMLNYAGEQSDGEITFEPTVVPKGKMVRNSKVKMSDDAVAYINRLNKTEWSFNDEFHKLADEAKDKGLKLNEMLYGLLLDEVSAEGKYVEDIESEYAKYEADKLDIDRMIMAYEIAGQETFYMNWDQTVSGRYMLANRMINPQNSKLSRFLIGTVDTRSKLEFKDGKYDANDLDVVRGAIAQAFGLDIDKNLDEVTIKELADKYVSINDTGKVTYANTKEGQALSKAVKAYMSGDTSMAINHIKTGMGIHSDERMHAYQVLNVLGNLPKKSTFEHNLVLESDAITNGMILTLLEIGSDWAMDMVARGGIYANNNLGKYKNHGEYKNAGGLDIYETPIEAVQKNLDNQALSPVSKKALELAGKNWRKALKPLVMVYIYGASIKSIRDKASDEFVRSVLNELIKTRDFNGMNKLLQDLKGPFDVVINPKDVAKGARKVYKKVNRFSASTVGMVELNGYHMYQLKKIVNDEIGSALEAGFEQSFREVSKYRQLLKASSMISYVAFSQELGRRVKDRDTVTVSEVEQVLQDLQKEGLYYGEINSSGSLQDYVKVKDTGDGKPITVTGYMNLTAPGSTQEITVNSAKKWFASNIGAIGVINIHDKDGRVMEMSDKDQTLNVYDAKLTAANYKVSNRNVKSMNKAVIDVSRNHSVLAEMVEKASRVLDKVDVSKMSEFEINTLTADIERVFGADVVPTWLQIAESVKEITKDRNRNLSKDMYVNHVYALDKFDGFNAGTADNVRVPNVSDEKLEMIDSKFKDIVYKTVISEDVKPHDEQGMSKEQYDKLTKELKAKGLDIKEITEQLKRC